ncbi:acyltransferase [Gimesia sp.]|uniref:acyltransferase family protein n=1 Tax=Gimesia sp. TaxID=2024833 RepID=UPI0032EFF313
MFNDKLESLRGIAALVVAIYHSFLVFAVDQNQVIWESTLFDVTGTNSFLTRMALAIFNGSAAVSIFFVLSGYVLGLSLDRKPRRLTTYHAFYIKRFFRIYPTYFVSLTLIVLSIVLFHSYIKFPNTSLWYNWWYTEGITLKNALANYSLVKIDINNVAWTLKVELIISLFFPLFYLINRRFGLKVNLLFLLGLIIMGYTGPIIDTIQYAFMFHIGLMLPYFVKKQQSPVSSFFCGNLAFMIGLVCLLSARLFLAKIDYFFPILVEGIASGFLIWILLSTEENTFFNRFLKINLVKKLGKYSYSFYLFHFIVMYWLAYCMFLVIPPEISATYPVILSSLLAVISIPITYFIAIVSYKCVEVPMIKHGAVIAEVLSTGTKRSLDRIALVVIRWRRKKEFLPLSFAFKRFW